MCGFQNVKRCRLRFRKNSLRCQLSAVPTVICPGRRTPLSTSTASSWGRQRPGGIWSSSTGGSSSGGRGAASSYSRSTAGSRRRRSVRDYGRRGYGPAKVREELRRRGVPRELWDAAMEELPDSGAVLDALIQKKCRGELSDPREIKRVSDSLLRRGFSWGEVRSALSRYTELAEE